jgi:hypothetical protein
MVKHTGKKEKKSRKLKLPSEITPVFNDYVVVTNFFTSSKRSDCDVTCMIVS